MSEQRSHSANRQDELFPLLEQRLETVLQEWKLPGMALAVVKDNELIFAKGYGVRTAGEHSPITEHTLFGVASRKCMRL
jgi:CubicO group peptidase (beta-lactamase class C family)